MKYRYAVITEADKKLPFYLIGAGCSWNQEPVNCPHGYHYQWIQCIHGEGELITAERTFRIKEGDGMLLIEGMSHQYHAISAEWIVDWVVFDGTAVQDFLKGSLAVFSPAMRYTESPELFSSLIHKLLHTLWDTHPLRSYQSSLLIYELLIKIVQQSFDHQNSSIVTQHQRIAPVLAYIEQNYQHTISLEELARLQNLTPQHLCSVFKSITSVRIFQYINNLRIQKSKEMLLGYPAMQIKEAALKSGFSDVNYYCSVFKKTEGISPGDFRRLFLVLPTYSP